MPSILKMVIVGDEDVGKTTLTQSNRAPTDVIQAPGFSLGLRFIVLDLAFPKLSTEVRL